MSGDRVVRYRGCLAAVVNDETAAQIKQMIVDHEARTGTALVGLSSSTEWHVTLVTKQELKALTAAQIDEVLALPAGFAPIGLGGYPGHGLFFVVCVWPKAQAFRQRVGLPRHEFHITVSTVNKHDVDKTFSAVFERERVLESLPMTTLEALSRELLLGSKFDDSFDIATQLCERFSDTTYRGWVRLADAALATEQTKLAMLSYAYAMTRTPDPTIRKYCIGHMLRCSDTTEWGPAFHESELEQVPTRLRPFLLRRWPRDVRLEIAQAFSYRSRLTLASREHLYVLSSDMATQSGTLFYRLPRFFRWVVPFVLAGMSTPRREEDIAHLAASLNIHIVVTLTIEEPLPFEWFTKYPTIQNIFLPVKNYGAPSLEQIDVFMSLFDQDQALPVLVHCGGGKGRAGVMLACYLVAFGFVAPIPADQWRNPAMSGAAAVEALRALRPGSIETAEQEQAVSAYCSTLWKRQSVQPISVAEPLPSTPVFEGADISTTDLLVLCGVPGSGKSSFRSMLVKRVRGFQTSRQASRNTSKQVWIELSGDEDGRAGCERSIGSMGSGARVILDRCNGKIEDRKLFLSLASTWSKHATAVWFDFPRELCEYRAQRRSAHPTLRQGQRVRNAINDHSKHFVPPELAEGFQSVVRVTSVEAARVVVESLSQPLQLIKFPRTPHLINLGAATDDDIVLSDSEESSVTSSRLPPGTEIVITEKLDGANLGISLDQTGYGFVVQNRSHYISSNSHPQFRKLGAFLQLHREDLMHLLARDPLFPERYILFGEWLAATHSIPYTRLKSLFYAFSLFDRETHSFLDRRGLEMLMQDVSIPLVRLLWRGTELPPRSELIAMVQQPSPFYDGRIEGIYIKWEKDGAVKERAKIVRSDFISGNEHWTRGPLQLNGVLSRAST